MATPQTQTSTPSAPRLTGPANTLARREQVNTDYRWIVPVGHKPEYLAIPDYWVHIAHKFRSNDEVIVICADQSWRVNFWITATDSTWVRGVAMQTFHAEPVADPTPERSMYKIDHIADGWRVIHKDTGKVLKGGIQHRAGAEAEIDKIIAKKTAQ